MGCMDTTGYQATEVINNTTLAKNCNREQKTEPSYKAMLERLHTKCYQI